jgi:type I restriction enzyme S subunit
MVGMYDTAAMKMSLLNRDGTFNQAVAGVKPNSKIDMEFIFYALNYTKPYVLTLRTGVRQRNLSLAKIKNIAVRVPDLSTQIEITKKLNECKLLADNLNNIFIQKVNGYQSLKKSILTQAFNGELTKA